MSKVIRKEKYEENPIPITYPSYGEDSFAKSFFSNQEIPLRPSKFTRPQVEKIIKHQAAEFQEKLQLEKEEVFRNGFEDGKQSGYEKGKNEIKETVSTFTSFFREIKKQRENLLLEAEKDVIKLALFLAEKIVNSEIKTNPEKLYSLVKDALAHLVDKETFRLKVSSQDYPLVKKFEKRILDEIEGIKNLSIEEDPRVRKGGCLVETDSGNIDARIESQLEVLREALLGENK